MLTPMSFFTYRSLGSPNNIFCCLRFFSSQCGVNNSELIIQKNTLHELSYYRLPGARWSLSVFLTLARCFLEVAPWENKNKINM